MLAKYLYVRFSPHHRYKKYLLLLLLSLSTFTFATSAAAELAAEQRLTIAGINANWGPPAPFLHAKNGFGYALSTFVFDPLVWRDQQGKIVPAIAERWEIDPELKSFHFYLNPRAKWHDGKALTAHDVAFTVAYMEQHPYVFADTDAISEVEIINDHEIIFHTDKPFPPFMTNIALGMLILPKHIYQDVDNPVKFSDEKAYIGSGPYQVANFDRVNKSYLLQAFNDYHRGQPRVAEIAILSVQPAAVAKVVQSGEIDMITKVAPKQEEALAKQGFAFLRYSAVHPLRLKFNFDNPLFQSAAVRQAFARAIDREALIDKAYHKQAELWSAGGLRSLEADKDDHEIVQYPYDPEALKGLVAKGTTLRMVTDTRIKKAAQVIATQLKDVGIGIDLVVTERAAANAAFRKGDYDLGLVTFSVLGDPIVFQQIEIGDRIEGDQYRENAELNTLLTEQITEKDAQKRAEMVRQASIIYAKEVPSVSLVSQINNMAYRPQTLKLYWNGRGLGRGIPIAMDREAFAQPFRR